ncbi:MAG: aminotransferase class III-fold pyridoxal phosphate-dependent enzyme [Pseudomonadota bacterium]
MGPYKFAESQALFERSKSVVPGAPNFGLGHYSIGSTAPAAPIYLDRSEGARFWDVDGNEFIDGMCAYGPMVLGYNNPVVEEAAAKQREQGSCTTLVGPVMVELAETLVDMVPIAEWAIFSKNGADPTNIAAMTARAATGRRKIVKVRGGYHGATPWMQETGNSGTIAEDQEQIINVRWNNVEQLEQVFTEHGDDIAGFISSAYHHPVFKDNQMPDNGYWGTVISLCKKYGAVSIVDDVRSGFRCHLGGACEYFGFKPDLICFGKALGNGYPISALVGTEEMREAVAQVFYTGTNFFAAVPMAAALATLKELQRIDGANQMIAKGERLRNGMMKAAEKHGHDLRVTGMPSMPYFRLANDETWPDFSQGTSSLNTGLHGRWISNCVQRGVYFLTHHNHFLSTAHTDTDIDEMIEIVDEAFGALNKV